MAVNKNVNAGARTVRPRRRDAARNRDALIAAGRELFDANGLTPTLDDVARHAGVGVGTAYRHFPNKYALAQAVLAESVTDMLDAADRAAQLDDAAAGLAALFDAVLEPQAAKRALGRVLRDAPDTAPPVDDVHTRIENCIDTLLERAREQQVVRSDITATDIGVLMSLMGHLIERFGDVDAHLWRRFLPILLHGLRADAPAPLPGTALNTEDFISRLGRSTQP
ncbi:putative transcriptional regulator, TetR family protein [Streptomyces sulfonofaciens]|uniref:Transcriptional regulator, TetR family protein n=1 Tax=Streptomyces sulfonofaciens TaxID=68272 RepID=A0A919GQ69_9ACTN|nr:TetR/AcrR family transcriptional regulator [Streptomyces sulfonofaciens]GHH88732.1 putative transcriptional regulator, TetR family protein [Streptomyces sulfonofaciens]